MLQRYLRRHHATQIRGAIASYRHYSKRAPPKPKSTQPQPASTSTPHATPPPSPRLLSSRTRLPQWSRHVLWFLAGMIALHIETTYFFSYEPCYGISMLPTINSFGDNVLISKHYRRGRGVEVGDLVSFKHPVDENIRAIKRVTGLAGDFVLIGTPGLGKGEMLRVPQGHCWLVGDNVEYSRDSRMFGPLPMALIQGKVIAIFSPWYWPHKAENTLRPAEIEDDID